MPEVRKSKVGSLGVGASLVGNSAYLLRSYLEDTNAVPLEAFKKTDYTQAIRDAISYLTSKKQGIIEVPIIDGNNEFLIKANINKSKNVVINYICNNYRFPINRESRPITNDSWQLGDIVLNNQYDESKCFGWVCTEAGTPGKWESFGLIKKWFSQVEVLNSLPDANEMQLGRQVLIRSNSGINICYICVRTNSGYTWIKQNNLSEGDIHDRLDSLFEARFSSKILSSIKQLIVRPTLSKLDEVITDGAKLVNIPNDYRAPVASRDALGSIKLGDGLVTQPRDPQAVSTYDAIRLGSRYNVGEIARTSVIANNFYLECTVAGTTADTNIRYDSNLLNSNFIIPSNYAEITHGTAKFRVRDTKFDSQLAALVDAIYPVGSIYISTNAAPPSVILKRGTWESIESGRVLLSQGNSYPAGSTGGEFSHAISMDELPNHTHNATAANDGAHSHVFRTFNDDYNNSLGGGVGFSKDGANNYVSHNDLILSAGGHSHNITVSSTGKSKAMSLMQPYLSVYMWKRIS